MHAIVYKIEADLLARAPSLGESRLKMARVHYCLPIGLHYWIDDRPDATGTTNVTVARVWRVRHRRRRR